jgi:hypothetical protein
VTAFGADDDTPLAGDWDGDGADEPVQISAMEVDTVLSQLVARPEGARTDYDRDLFTHWTTTNGCDTRERVLWAEAITAPSVSSSCSLTGGTWRSPYDDFQSTSSSDFHVDHMVPLAEAWDSGANGWTAARRQAFANDVTYPGALVVASASSNTSKSDQDPAEWQPTNTAHDCVYASDWLRTKLRWLLGADLAEWTALQQMLHSCPNGRLTSSTNVRPPNPALPVLPPPPPPPPPPTGCSTNGSAYVPANGGCIDRYDADHNGDINCTELPAAAKPVTVKNPGNDPYGLDGDSDGLGCE